ncbi:hypothetical protein DFJ58DRAFT_842130 [Suillus subalutaceus]|uniref:uncharacterized protein n=1 Tax=Suillus subalutaceus TaxID=48586 RepID=UPI001B86EF20|nr:uncharacterized protein DFJ58DRAFT_842130 [Suillus subalutaceus]KAG1851425.1 hypothetical protein DFJ58DRAFT_842130 [Suillus subalutaceus]
MARSQSPIVVLQQNKVPLDKAEVTVLRAHLEDWKSVKGKERARTYKEWLQNHSHQKPSSKPLIKYGRTWTARKVLVHTHKALIQEEMGEMAGSGEMISKWPKAAKTRRRRRKPKQWQISGINEAAPPEVQAHVAETKGADMIEHFATKMFKKAGMRVFVLSAWMDGKGKLMLGGHDFNEQFANSESFMKTRDWEGHFHAGVAGICGGAIRTCPDAEDGKEPQMVKSKKRVPRKLIKLEEDADGWPILPDTKGWKRADQHHMIRSFLTTLYMSEQECAAAKITSRHRYPGGMSYIANQHSFKAHNGPPACSSRNLQRWTKWMPTAVLDFWFDRQQHNIQPGLLIQGLERCQREMHVAAVSPSGTLACSNSDEHNDGGLSGAIDQGAQSTGEEEEISLGRQYTPTPRTNSNSAEVGNPMKAKGATSCRNVSNTLTDISDAMNVAILNGSGNARQPDQSQKTLKEAVAAGTRTRSKAAANISNERPKGLKWHAADPVSDTPAKRTRSKATALAASKSKRK